MKRIILDQRERCGAFLFGALPYATGMDNWYETIGLEQDGDLIAVVLYNIYSGADIAMHVAAVDGSRWMTRSYLRAVFRYPFVQLGVRRVSGFVPASNAQAIRFNEHLGFKREGLMREALWDDDVIVFGMLRQECKYHG
jgi:RimJ/RimL family protein N-acetyltransferase